MPVQLLPCPFCGGKAEVMKDDPFFFVVEHDSWQCPMAAASKEVFQIASISGSTEWNERAECGCGENSLQQLKAEIAAVVHDMFVDSKKVCGIELEYYLNRLRQLSAI